MRLAAILLAALALAGVTAGAAAAGAPPPVRARAWLVEDARTGQVLASSNANERMPIASITKLMTVLVALQHHRLGDVVAVDPRAAAVGQSSAYLQAGELLTVRELVEAALIQSANDAADALALSVSPSFPAFAVLMNAEARRLGLRDSHFVRPDGLDAPGEYSTASDVTRLAWVAMRTRFIRDTVREQTATIADGEVLHTWDDLLTLFPETIGVKTGHTSAAGWCQVAAARGPGVTVYATLLGSPSRDQRNDDLQGLLVWGLAQFRIVPAVQAGRIYTQVGIGYGKAPLDLVASKQLLAVVRLGRTLRQVVLAPLSVSLPVHRGEVIGRVEVRDGSRIVGRRPLVAARTINKPGPVGRLRWYAGRAIHHLAHLL